MFELLLMLIIIICLTSLVTGITYFFFKRKFLRQLREYPNYSENVSAMDSEITFQYSLSEDENLEKLRKENNLDQIAGEGSEINTIVNLMKWVHNLAYHTPNPSIPENMNSLILINLCKSENKKLSCWLFATILNDVYLSMGFYSRMIHLNPPKKNPRESHIVNVVFSRTLKKWLFIDADFGAYFTNKNNVILSLEEIRDRLMNNKTIIPNDDMGVRIQSKVFASIANYLGKKTYQTYITKNIFRLQSPICSEFGYESKNIQKTYVELIPLDYDDGLLEEPHITKLNNKLLYTSNPQIFWQTPSRILR